MEEASPAKGTHPRTAYDTWSPFYDTDYAHLPMRRIVYAFVELARRYHAPGQRLLDLGCGTGASALALADLGYAVTGCDISPEMLAIARSKPHADRVRFVEADLRHLPDLDGFHVATAVNDPLSHLLTERDLTAALREVARVLAPGGVLVFDQRTETAYRRVCGRTLVSDREDQRLRWSVVEHDIGEEGAVFGMRIERDLRCGDAARQVRHEHFLRYRSTSLLRRLLGESGLECVGVHGLDGHCFLRESPDETVDTTVLYVARRPHSVLRAHPGL
ncbi:class I SAM-dependent DNA methyltransferase [Streptoalloteichus hindustanus]|uniref:Methyltransferase domain-containing protein n=1 Tax=Streptoalloteichus hindustanus TaxID=2017 RepID=A0A1M5P1V1_STRHI|nr:class I SAM-dependent methyltransferase [Streptoalloteichus hindustanus]SHG95814.1 Methyltransferase domain-containing protein [Streptoalloteichus hindustanus]